MPPLIRGLVTALSSVLAVGIVLFSNGALSVALAQAAGFIETFGGSAPTTPTDYTNPHNWDIMIQGFNAGEASIGATIAQHGPNCEPPGFPYTPTNSHLMTRSSDTVFVCNNHVMTSAGLTGYGAIYMTPPAVMDFSGGTAVLKWDMSTLRTSARDWVDITLTPFSERSNFAYNNNDQHIPPDNIHVLLAGTNAFLATERVNGGTLFGQGTDVPISSNGGVTWDMVQAAQNPPLVESPARRDSFEVDLSATHLRVCINGNNTGSAYTYNGQSAFCWIDANLPTILSSSVWGNQAAVMFGHRTYNPEKACIDTQNPPPANPLDQFNIDHSAYGDANCPADTWHWANVSINPSVPFTVIQPTQDYNLTGTSPQTVTFTQPAPANTHLEFTTFGANSQLQVSFDNGATWQSAVFQPAMQPGWPTNGDENGEQVWMPVPTGLQSVQVRGVNGFWGTVESFGFHLVAAPGGSPPVTSALPPTSTPTPVPTVAPTPPTPVPTVAPAPPAPAPLTLGADQQLASFDDLTSPNRVLTGQYPTAVMDWGSNAWYLSGPYAQFTGNSISFPAAGPSSASFSFVTPRKLWQIDADNGGNASSTVTLSCNGQPTVRATLNPGQRSTIVTNWSGYCANVTVGSSNGWETNFKNLVYSISSGAPQVSPTVTPVVPTPTAVTAVTTLSFNDLSSPNRPLTGQYPTGLINWGTGAWYLSAPWGRFTGNSISFNGPSLTSASFSFVAPHQLTQIDAYNGGTASSTITIACAGQTSKVVTLAAGSLSTIQTGWSGACSTVTISSTNGWDTNFDNLVVR